MNWRSRWQEWHSRHDPSAAPVAPDRPPGPPITGGEETKRGRRRREPAREHPAFTRDALRRAWRKVRASGGGAGVDGQDIASFERELARQLDELSWELARGVYRPRAVRRVFVPKPNGGLRPLAMWALRDRVAQRAVYDYLEPFFEPKFLDCSHGFRPGRSVQTATRAVLAARDEGLRWVLDGDIKDCFDRIEARHLMTLLRHRVKDRTVLELVERWLAADILDAQGRRAAAGTAQGSVLSPLLCNVYLHPFDVALTRRGIRLVRYADDLVCLFQRKREAQDARALVQAELAKLALELHPQKTRLVSFDDGFAFLGIFFLRDEHFILAPGATRPARARAQGHTDHRS